MSTIAKSRLLTTSAIAGISILQLGAAAHAQEQTPAFGVHVDLSLIHI